MFSSSSMFFDASIPPDPQGPDEAWDALDMSAAACDEPEALAVVRGRAAVDSPDTVDHLVEIANMVTMRAAQRLITRMRYGGSARQSR